MAPTIFIVLGFYNRILPVELQESFAGPAGNEIMKVDAGHMVQLSQTQKVAGIIASQAN